MAARGIKASGGTDFQSGYVISADEMNTDLNNLVTGVNNLVVADANVVAGANIDPSKIGDFADNTPGVYQTNAAPGSRGHSDTVTASGFAIVSPSYPLTLEEELSRLRYFWKQGNPGTVDNTTGLPVSDVWYALVEKGNFFFGTGMTIPYFGTTAPAGWIKLDDGAIGNTASGASNRASYDTRELFRMWWRMFDDAHCPVSGGRGADPDADFNANKTIRMPLMAGRVPGIAGTPNAGNISESIATLTCSIDGTTTTCRVATSGQIAVPISTDLIGYTITVLVSSLGNTGSQVISGVTNASGTITHGAFANITKAGDTFTITKTIPTRAHGDAAGKHELMLSGLQAGASTGAGNYEVSGFLFGQGKTSSQPPTYFLNWICKL